MPHLKLKGFVIREVPVGEADRIINILTADYGLISASARGARRTRSQLLMTTQIFALSEFELFVNKGHYTVNGAELIESFSQLQQDLDRLVCAAHLAEVLLDATRDAAAQPDVYRLWAFSLQALQALPDPLLTVHLAQMRLLAVIGFSPCVDLCVQCGEAIGENARFSIKACGTLCDRPGCRQKTGDSSTLSAGALASLQHALDAPLERLFNCRLSPEARRDFINLSDRYLTHQMEKSYSRLNLLKDLEALSIQGPAT